MTRLGGKYLVIGMTLQALTCFRRAVQLDPTCAYAYMLSGHESIDEDLEKAINFFQSALQADSRHYNTW